MLKGYFRIFKKIILGKLNNKNILSYPVLTNIHLKLKTYHHGIHQRI